MLSSSTQFYATSLLFFQNKLFLQVFDGVNHRLTEWFFTLRSSD